MRFSVLASGSSGNACFVETDDARILIDAGISSREILRRLEILGIEPQSLDALIITHEHIDHIKGAGPLSRHLNLPVYANRKTLQRGSRTIGNLSAPLILQTGQTVTVKDLTLETFTKCHDAADPFGLVVSCSDIRIGIATDLGRSTRLVEDRLKGCQVFILEFNHDEEMLKLGPYPLSVKRRIMGQDGHLSNGQAVDLLRTISSQELEVLVVAHLSETNNDAARAYAAARKALDDCGLGAGRILMGKQDEPGPMIEIG